MRNALRNHPKLKIVFLVILAIPILIIIQGICWKLDQVLFGLSPENSGLITAGSGPRQTIGPGPTAFTAIIFGLAIASIIRLIKMYKRMP
jgi:hypothetical protein